MNPNYELLEKSTGDFYLILSGDWTTLNKIPSHDEVIDELRNKNISAVRFDSSGLGRWDSGFLTFLLRINSFAEKEKIKFDDSGFPEGVRKLIKLANAVPVVDSQEKDEIDMPLLDRIGSASLRVKGSAGDMLDFIGQIFLSFSRMFAGKAVFRRSDFLVYMQQAGAEAILIVTIINLLVGLIIAFVGAVQLKMFGAEIYVADLVGLGMVREMSPMMTAIIMAGRSGASYAAQLGTMMVNEEIDALITFGFNPIDFLVLPRLMALVLMMPLLVLYADFIGIIGGMIVGVGMLDISFTQYYEETIQALSPLTFLLGIIKGTIYGFLVGFAGCYRGMQSGRSSAAVGASTTSAVVTGIIMIIVASAVTTIIYYSMGW
ncbi:MAG: ABC transporter permease [Ignavibacteria bacterium]|nr:MAG: ABC transporter permease [Ignavibacteria bacterium]